MSNVSKRVTRIERHEWELPLPATYGDVRNLVEQLTQWTVTSGIELTGDVFRFDVEDDKLVATYEFNEPRSVQPGR